MKIVPFILRVPLESQMGAAAIKLLNDFHDKHICQDSLDLYRETYKTLLDNTKDEIYLMVAIYAGNIIGMSAAVVKDNEMHNSITVVSEIHRQFGIASSLMKNKIDAIKARYPHAQITTKVSKTNEPSLKACIKAGLKQISEGIDKRKEKEVAYAILGL